MDKTNYYKEASKRKVKVIDWVKIRNEYETTNISQRKLAKKYNINYGTIRDRSIRESWFKSKKETQSKIISETKQKTIENISDNQSKAIEKHYKISEYLLYTISKSLKNEKEFNTFVDKVKDSRDTESLKEFVLESINDKKLLNMVNAFEKLQKTQRQTLGIIDKDIEHKQEFDKNKFEHTKYIDKEKLKLEKERIGNESSLKPVIIVDDIEKYLEENND